RRMSRLNRTELGVLTNVPEDAVTSLAPGIAFCASNGMSDSSDHARFYIGIDGGGTSCRARIEDAQGRVLGQGAAGPATTRVGPDRCMRAVHTASTAAAADAGL